MKKYKVTSTNGQFQFVNVIEAKNIVDCVRRYINSYHPSCEIIKIKKLKQ